MTGYTELLARRQRATEPAGRTVDPEQVHPSLKPFQRHIVQWAIQGGRRAVWADTGLGKTRMQIEWARLSAPTALIAAPLAVCQQTIEEAAKIGVTGQYIRGTDGISGPGLYVTNHEMVPKIDPARFSAVALDEASILKQSDGKTRGMLIRHFRDVPARTTWTATPGPNDPEELTNQAEFLGQMTRTNMLAAYFIHDQDGWRDPSSMSMDDYITDDARGQGWHFMLGDSAERIAEIPEESVHLSVYSPPFESLYTYSPSVRDMGNSLDRADFFDQYAYIIAGNLRITVPGGLACVHVQQTTTTKATHGVIGMTDFRGDVIRAYQSAGWIYYGEVTVDKDPQAQAIRTKATALTFATKNRDSSSSRPALADYLLIFKKPGDRPEPVKTDCTNEEWIEWARPVWYGVQEGNTLNARIAREDDDERHLTPLQLDFIERCVRLYSNKGDTVFTAFGGVSSELYVALKLGRRAVGIELKPSYWATGCQYLRELEAELTAPSLLDALAEP